MARNLFIVQELDMYYNFIRCFLSQIHFVSSNEVLKKKDRYVVMSIILTRFTMGGRSIAQVPFQVHHVKNTTGCPR